MKRTEQTLGLVGLGTWGRNYLNTVGSGLVSNVRISSVCARTPESLALIGSQYLKSTDYRELVEHKLDGIIVASSSDTHFEIAEYFLRRGQNLLIEKPVTSTYQQALNLQWLHQEIPQAVVMVGHIQIYDPGYQALKRSLEKIGRITNMVFRGLQSSARNDSTVIENWGPHPVYLFEDIVGQRPNSITAQPTDNDNVHMDITFHKGIVGSVDIGSISGQKKREFTVTGQDGSLTLDWSGPQKTLTLSTSEGVTNIPFMVDASPLELEILEFVNCIRTKTKPRTPLSQGVEVMKVITAAQESLSHGGRRIDLTGSKVFA